MVWASTTGGDVSKGITKHAVSDLGLSNIVHVNASANIKGRNTNSKPPQNWHGIILKKTFEQN